MCHLDDSRKVKVVFLDGVALLVADPSRFEVDQLNCILPPGYINHVYASTSMAIQSDRLANWGILQGGLVTTGAI